MAFAEDSYFPFLKWKRGEVSALADLSGRATRRVTPLFVLPPAGDYDSEERRHLTPIEHIRSFGPRLAKSRGKRLAFVDAGHVDNERHASGLPTHPLTELLERARLAGAQASPITALVRSEGYQRAVARFVAANSDLPICLRITLGDLVGGSVAERLRDLLAAIGVFPHRCVLAIDLGIYDGHDPEGLVQALVQQVSDLPFRDEWRGLVLASTSFPESLSKIKAGEAKNFPRYDWSLYERLFAERLNLGRLPIFSDYAVEHPIFSKGGAGIQPTAHFRYSTDQRYLVVKGTSVRKPYGYEAIYSVAAALAAHDDYMGVDFSAGDRCIKEIAEQQFKGTAWLWRKASVNHHLEVVASGLSRLFGTTEEIEAPRRVVIQPPLF